MRALRINLLACALLAACSNTGAPPPTITAFTASPSTIGMGASSTLSWTVNGANSTSLDHGINQIGGASFVVSPTQTTTYTLTASGAGGSTTAQVTVTVTSQQAPKIVSFNATPDNLGRGRSSTLVWSATDATSFSLSPIIGPVAGNQTVVTPQQTTTYTLTATGPGGTATAQATVSVHDPVLHLEYTDPGASAGGVRLLKNRSSTATHVVLDAMVGSLSLNAYGIAMNLPFDLTRASLAAQGGFTPNAAALDPGAGQPTAAATVPAAGPLSKTLVLGLARKKRYANDGDVLLPPGTVLFSVAFDMVPNAAAGVVFDGVTPGPKFDAGLLKADGTRAVDKAGFAIGQLTVTY